MSFLKATPKTIAESRFGDPFDFDNEIESMLLPQDPPVTFAYTATDGKKYDVTIRPGRIKGMIIDLVSTQTAYTDIPKKERIATEKLIDKLPDGMNKSEIKGDFQKYGYADFYSSDATANSFTLSFSTKKAYLESLKSSDTPVLDEQQKTCTAKPEDVLQYYYDLHPTEVLPGETKPGETLFKFFKTRVLPEFVALIVIDENKKIHTYIYWTGDPFIGEPSVDSDKIVYYQITLPDQKTKDGQLLKDKLNTIYNNLEAATKLPPTDLSKKKANQKEDISNVSSDPVPRADLRTLIFNLDPVDPPDATQTHTREELRKGSAINPSSLIGWYITQPLHSETGVLTEKPNFDGFGWLKNNKGKVAKDFTFQSMAGHVVADFSQNQTFNTLYSRKIIAPEDIITVFMSDEFEIPTKFQPDNSTDAVAVGFTLKSFQEQVGFIIRYLRAYPNLAKINIEGYTDTQGGKTESGKTHNKTLSQQRADSFYSYLQNANETDIGIKPLSGTEAGNFVTSVIGMGQDAAAAALADPVKDLGTPNPYFRKIKIVYGVKPQ